MPPNEVSENGQNASLIRAVRGQVGDVRALLSETVKERSARVVVLFIVLAVLALVRSHTSFGKKYRPF